MGLLAAKDKIDHVDPDEVLRLVADHAPGSLAWSAIGARLKGIPRDQVKMPLVRGVRDAVRHLEEEGLVTDRADGVNGLVRIARCPRCDSPDPQLHPAVQHGGEVQPCPHRFHMIVTAANTEERIEETQALIDRWDPRYSCLGCQRIARQSEATSTGACPSCGGEMRALVPAESVADRGLRIALMLTEALGHPLASARVESDAKEMVLAFDIDGREMSVRVGIRCGRLDVIA
jgi:Zn finger protein HypA/HybF involved in hydrogenase expression